MYVWWGLQFDKKILYVLAKVALEQVLDSQKMEIARF